MCSVPSRRRAVNRAIQIPNNALQKYVESAEIDHSCDVAVVSKLSFVLILGFQMKMQGCYICIMRSFAVSVGLFLIV